MEIPTPDEPHDNIVAYWVAEDALKAGDTQRLHYRTYTLNEQPEGHALGKVIRTRHGSAAVPGEADSPSAEQRQFVVDFAGGLTAQEHSGCAYGVYHCDVASLYPSLIVSQDLGPAQDELHIFTGLLETSIGANEILTGIEVPGLNQNQVAEYAKMAHPATHFAVVGGAVVVTVEGGRCTAASVVVGGLVPTPLRARSVETALVGQELTMENITAASEKISIDLGSNVFGDSVFASAEFRRIVVGVEVKHALFHAVGLAHHDDGEGHDDHGHDPDGLAVAGA